MPSDLAVVIGLSSLILTGIGVYFAGRGGYLGDIKNQLEQCKKDCEEKDAQIKQLWARLFWMERNYIPKVGAEPPPPFPELPGMD